ncbi:Uncharacterised protein [uncultured archaeon]|nr:Uncharacterised protein [uncultured archaeon]
MPRSRGVRGRIFSVPAAFIVIFLISFAPSAWADCRPSYSDSIASAQDIPGGFQSITCSVVLPAKYVISGCLGLVGDTCLESVVPDVTSLNATLTAEEAANFSKAVNDLNRSADYIIRAQNKRNEIIYDGIVAIHGRSCTATTSFILGFEQIIGNPLDSFIGRDDSTSNLSLSLFTQPQGLDQAIMDCVLSGVAADGTAGEIIANERSALEAASMGLNSAMDVLQNEADALYCEGGGYGDHSLAAAVMYDKVRNFINMSNTQTTDGSADFGMRWASLCGNIQFLKSGYGSSGVTDCRTARILNSAISANSIFPLLVDMYREVRDARIQLKADLASANRSALEQFQYAMQARKRMQENQYNLINADVVSYFTNVSNDPSAVIPSESFRSMDNSLNSTGTSPGANTLLAEANKTLLLKEQFYYAIAIEKLNRAERLSTESIGVANRTESFVSSLLENAERITAAKRASAESAIASFTARGGVESIQQQLAVRRFNDTEKEYLKDEGRAGVRLRTLMNASMRYDEAADLVSAKGIMIASSIGSLGQSIQLLNSVISLAKSDGVNVYDAEQLVKDKSLLVQYANTTAVEADSAKAEIDAMAATLYVRAPQQYSDLSAKRRVALQTLDALGEAPGAPDMTQIRSNVSYLEGFVYSNGSFIPDNMLGHYKAARATYDNIITELSKRVSEVLKSYLPKKAKVIKTYQTVPVVDSAGAVTTSIDIVNDLPVNSSSPVTVSIQNVPVNVNSNFTFGQDGVRAAASGTGVDIYLSGVNEMSTYSIQVVTPYRVAELQKKSVSRVSLTQYELIEKTDYTIRVKDDLDSLTLNDATSADDCTAYVNGKEHSLLFVGGNFSARFSPVYAGTVQASVVCTTFNPMEVIESNSTGTDNNLDYLLSVRSTKSSLENVGMTLTLKANPNLIIPTSIRVSDGSDAAPKDFSYALVGGNYVAKWTIPILSQSFQVYRVFYTTTDIDQYYNELKSLVSSASAAEKVDVSAYVRDAEYRVGVGHYADATESLRRAQRIIDQGRNDRLQREAVANRLSTVSDKLSAVRNASSGILSLASSLSMPDTIFELNKQLAEFDSKKTQADLYLSMNDTGAALSAVKELEKMSESTSLDKTFYSKQESLFKSLSKQKSTSFALGAFGDTTDLINTIEAAENTLKSVSVDIASGAYSSAIATMSNVSSGVSSMDKTLSNRTGSMASEASAILAEAKSAVGGWKLLKDGVANALKVNSDNPGTRVDTTSLASSVSDTDKKATELSALYDKLKQYGANDILLNIAEFRQLKSKSSDVSDGAAYLEGIKDDYKAVAQESLNDTRTFIEQRLANASSNDEKQVLTSMQPLLIAAKDSYDSGLYLNSMILTDHIRNRIAGFVATPQPIVDPLVIYVVIVVVASVAVVVLLFRKEEPKSPRLIERFKLD